jgi:hypothetical protein
MKASLLTAAIVTMVLALGGVAQAQTYVAPAVASSASGYPGGYGYGYGYHSSTLEEGWLRGLGALAASQGEANYYNSLAAINFQDAYARYVQNRQKATDAYYAMRQAHREARAAQISRLTLDRYAALARRDAPQCLREDQYDRALGRLNWPAVLTGEEFAAEREAISAAFRARSPGDVGPSSQFYNTVKQLSSSLEAKLKPHIDDLDPAQYLAAKKFLQGLTCEANQPSVPPALASIH